MVSNESIKQGTVSPSRNKRKNNSGTSPKSKKKVKTAATSTTPEPNRILVIDNGGDTLKYGWVDPSTAKEQLQQQSPQYLPNITARLPQQWTVLVGDQLDQVQNRSALLGVTRSTERGIIVNLGNQIQVWKRLLDLLQIQIPLQTATAQALGWKKTAAVHIPSRTCAVLLALPPYCPRSLLDSILTVWMEDFGFARVGFCVSPVCAAVAAARQQVYETSCIVDLGWSHTTIVPVHQSQVVEDVTVAENHDGKPRAIRRLPLGGRHLINMWKHYVSYRQWNLMDQDWILRDVLHKTGYVSLDFDGDMRTALEKPSGRRPFDREFCLPDFQTTFEGQVRIPSLVQKELELSNKAGSDSEEDDSDDEDVKEEDMMEEDEEDDGADAEQLESEDEDEETVEQKRARLLRQKREEEQRRRELESEQQILKVSVERFTVPEVLFRPSDGGLPVDWGGLPEAISSSIQSCPQELQPALYRSIRCIGGLVNLPNLSKRLEQELRMLIPNEYDLRIEVSDSPIDEAWHGAAQMASSSPMAEWSVSRDEWENASRRVAWRRLLMQGDGGIIV